MSRPDAERREFLDRNGRLIVLRRAQVDDARALIECTDRVAVERRYITMDRLDIPVEQEQEFICRLEMMGDLFLVAEHGGRLVGSLTAMRGRGAFRAHVAEFGLSLVPEYRDAGIGRAMIAYTMDWCRSRGVEKLNLEVFADNDRAIALYRSMGFIEEGIRRRQVKIDGRYIDLIQMTVFP